MYIYANGFQVSAKSDQSEVLIRFLQTTPQFGTDENGETRPVGTQEEIVSSIIISGSMAHALIDNISNLLGEEHPDE